MSFYRRIDYACQSLKFPQMCILACALLAQGCGGGSGGADEDQSDNDWSTSSSIPQTQTDLSAEQDLGTAKSIAVKPLILTSALSYQMQIRPVSSNATGEWSDDVSFTFAQDDDPDTVLSEEEVLKDLVRSSNRLQWTGDEAAYAYEIRAISAVDGTVVAETQFAADEVCENSVCQLEPVQLPNSQSDEMPVAVISQPVVEGQAPLAVVLDGLLSTDAESDRLHYRWHVQGRFVELEAGPVFKQVFNEVGEHRVILEVMDEAGNRNRAYGLVVVHEPDGESELPDDMNVVATVEEEIEQANSSDTRPVFLNIITVYVTVTQSASSESGTSITTNVTTATVPENAANFSGLELASESQSNPSPASEATTETGSPAAAQPDNPTPALPPIPVEQPSTADNPFAVVASNQPAETPTTETTPSAKSSSEPNTDQESPGANTPETSDSDVSDSEGKQLASLPSITTPVKEPTIEVEAPPAPPMNEDTKSPIISDVSVIDIRTNRVSIKWHLDEYAKGYVEFGESAGYLDQRTNGEDSFDYNIHIQQVKELEPATTYYYQIISEDASGNMVQSDQFEFTTSELVVEQVAEAPQIDHTAVADGWPSNANEELPLAGIFYGNPFAGIGTANSQIALESSRRFRAERTGQINYVRYHNRILRDYEITARCESFGGDNKYCKCENAGLDGRTCGYTMNSYSVGNGGTIVVEMRPDDGNGYPSDIVLGKTLPFVPADNLDKWYPALEFETIPTIEAGGIYHLVYTNLTPPSTCELINNPVSVAGSCPRNEGAMSLNGNFHLSVPETTGRFGPYRGDKSAATMWRRDLNGKWNLYDRTVSYFELGYTDGVAVGDSYYADRAASEGTQTIGGKTIGRQHFTVRDASRTVTGLWLNFGHRANADGSAMTVQLKTSSGSTLAQGSIASSAKCRAAVNKSSTYAEETCREWGYIAFDSNISLIEGDSYYVEISAGELARFAVSTYQPFTTHGFTDRNHWFDAYAKVSFNNGSSWEDWAHGWGAERDMALAFTIQGMPIQMP